MKTKEQDPKKDDTEQGSSMGPMNMGMEMAKKMMDQMGQGGLGPMAMMQKMMAQMSKRQEGTQPMPPMMQMCMGMCAEMLTAVKRTTDLAALATPELHTLFSEWLDTKNQEVLTAIDNSGLHDLNEISKRLDLTTESTAYLLARMATTGKLVLQVEKSGSTTKAAPKTKKKTANKKNKATGKTK